MLIELAEGNPTAGRFASTTRDECGDMRRVPSGPARPPSRSAPRHAARARRSRCSRAWCRGTPSPKGLTGGLPGARRGVARGSACPSPEPCPRWLPGAPSRTVRAALSSRTPLRAQGASDPPSGSARPSSERSSARMFRSDGGSDRTLSGTENASPSAWPTRRVRILAEDDRADRRPGHCLERREDASRIRQHAPRSTLLGDERGDRIEGIRVRGGAQGGAPVRGDCPDRGVRTGHGRSSRPPTLHGPSQPGPCPLE